MLTTLRMKSFAVIDECELNLGPGLTVLTGETGAGKSILIDALALLLGGRTRIDVIRSGATEAVVEGVFDCHPVLRARLEALGISDQGSELLIRRSFSTSGKSRVHVNGDVVTVGVLQRLMQGQVDLAGQHEHMALFDVPQHQRLVDAFGVSPKMQGEFETHFKALAEVGKALDALGGDERQWASRLDFLNFQISEIDRLSPVAGEESQLESARRRLLAEAKQHQNLEAAETLLSQSDGAGQLLDRVFAQVKEAQKHEVSLLALSAPTGPDAEAWLKTLAARLAAIRAEIEDLSLELSKRLSKLKIDPLALDALETRLDSLKKLARKHAMPLEALIEKRRELAAEREAFLARDETRGRLLTQQNQLMLCAHAAAEALSVERHRCAKQLTNRVEQALSRLALRKARFEVSIGRIDLTARGIDHIEFLFSANVGEPLRPLAKVASGGEASRVMLALKSALSSVDEVRCSVLDEADAGLGGAVADEVGKLVQALSQHRQVLCITHVPQVAAYADAHLRVSKYVASGRTKSEVTLLDATQRAGELARMISGQEVTPEAVSAARALIRGASAGRHTGKKSKVTSAGFLA
jgi:DNA repair protein RecN (Recombination protein N)